MNEKAYKTMSYVGMIDIISGIVVVVIGIAAGVLMIVGGARLLKRKSDLTF